MTSASDIDRLISAAAACLREHDHHDVANALQLVLVGADDLPACMGVGPGWRTAARLRARNAALQALARHLGHSRPSPLAYRIEQVINRYAAAGWLIDRRAGRRPDDDLLGLAFDFLCVSRPLSARRLRELLAGTGDDADGDRQSGRAA